MLLSLPLLEMARALAVHNYVEEAAVIHDKMLSLLSAACFGLAACLALFPSLRRVATGHLESLGRSSPRKHALWIGLSFFGIWAWLWFVRYCVYRGCLLTGESAGNIGAAYNFLRHGELHNTVQDLHLLSVHFTLLEALFSPPVLLVWNSPVSLLFLSNLIVVSAPLAVYCLVWELTASSLAGMAGMLLALSGPAIHEILAANLDFSRVSQVALPLWAMLFLAKKRWVLFSLFALLMIGSGEEAPLFFFGMGIWAVHALGWREKRSWVVGLGFCVASAVLWNGEMAVLGHYARGAGGTDTILTRPNYFRHLVTAGTPADNILSEMVLHPLRTVARGLSSRYRVYPAFKLLFSAGFFPLAAPWAAAPFFIVVLPHVLSLRALPESLLGSIPADANFFNLGLHWGSPVAGALWGGMAYGLQAAYRRLKIRRRQGWILVWALFIGGFGFKHANRALIPSWRPAWFDAMPRMGALIPPQARVWADSWAMTSLSNRRWLQIVTFGPDGAHWRYFHPDYVLFPDAFLAMAQPPYSLQVLTFLAQNGYVKIAEDGGLILLRSPVPDPEPENTPEWIQLPPPDLKLAAAYARNLLGNGPDFAERLRQVLAGLNETGASLFSRGELGKAADLFREALILDPRFIEARNNLGSVLGFQRRLPEAEAQYREALKLDPLNAGIHFNLGNCLLARGKRRDAVVQYTGALRLNPNFEEARRKLRQAQASGE